MFEWLRRLFGKKEVPELPLPMQDKKEKQRIARVTRNVEQRIENLEARSQTPEAQRAIRELRLYLESFKIR